MTRTDWALGYGQIYEYVDDVYDLIYGDVCSIYMCEIGVQKNNEYSERECWKTLRHLGIERMPRIGVPGATRREHAE